MDQNKTTVTLRDKPEKVSVDEPDALEYTQIQRREERT